MVSAIDTLISVGFLIGLPLILTVLSKMDMQTGMIGYAQIIAPFFYKAGMIELWVIIILLIINVVLLFIEIKKYVGVNG